MGDNFGEELGTGEGGLYTLGGVIEESTCLVKCVLGGGDNGGAYG